MNSRSSTKTDKTFGSVYAAFRKAVNMTPAEIRTHLRTDESKKVGFVRRGETESVGRQSAKKIISILEHGPSSTADIEHMRKVVGYVARHSVQRPGGDVQNTRWHASMKNWGRDVLK